MTDVKKDVEIAPAEAEEDVGAPNEEVQSEDEAREAAEYDDFDDVDLTFLQPKEEKEKALAEVDAEEKTPPVVEEKKQETVAQQPQQPPQPEPTQTQPQPTQESSDPEAGRRAAEEADRVVVEKLSEFFKLSDEEKEAVNVDASEVLPKMAARVAVWTMKNAVLAIQSLLPQVLEQHAQQKTRESAAMDEFYTTWPQLKEREDAKPLVAQYANFYRNMNPKASQQDAIKAVGASVMVALGLQAAPASQPTPGADAVNSVGNGSASSRRESLPPHKPAAATTLRDMAPAQPSNIFEAMALEPDE